MVSEWGWDRRLLATVDNAPTRDSQASYTFLHGVSVIVDDWLDRDQVHVRAAGQGARRTQWPRALPSATTTRRRASSACRAVRRGVSTTPPCASSSRWRSWWESRSNRIEVRHRLTQSEHTLQSIVDNAPVAIHVVDDKGRFLLVNRELDGSSACRATCSSARPGLKCPGLVDGMPIAALVDDLDVLQQRNPVAVEQTTSEPDGVHSYLSVNFPLARRRRSGLRSRRYLDRRHRTRAIARRDHVGVARVDGPARAVRSSSATTRPARTSNAWRRTQT